MKAIRTRYIGASNVKGSRIQAKCEARTIYLSYDHALNGDENHAVAARALRDKMEWKGAMIGGTYGRDMYWIFTDSAEQVSA